MELLGAGARAATGDGVQAGAPTVLLTIGLEELIKGRGATTSTGDVIDAGAARRFACTARVTPPTSNPTASTGTSHPAACPDTKQAQPEPRPTAVALA
jgi:hypothetical protein